MSTWLARFVFIIMAAMALSGISIAGTEQKGDTENVYNFPVWLDVKPIGYHKVSVNREANRKTVHTQANFDVRLLFIPVYSYDHETRESWVDNCLVDISSTTDDNGEDYFVSSVRTEAQLAVETREGVTALNGCIRTFAYWDVDLLKSERLLNTQTGEYLPVEVADMGTETLAVYDDEIEARRFRLTAEDMTIDLWYTRDMRWLALESVTDSGAVLRYLPERLAAYEPEADS